MKESKISAASGIMAASRTSRMPNGDDTVRGASSGMKGRGAIADRIDAMVPAGVHNDSYSQALAPFMGQHALPSGQTINVTMNAPSPHLPFDQWVKRGVVGNAGNLAAWPFRVIGRTIESAAMAVLDIAKTFLKWALIVTLIPALLVIGARIASHVNQSPTIEGGTRGMMNDGRHALRGIGQGASEKLQTEVPEDERPVRRHSHTNW